MLLRAALGLLLVAVLLQLLPFGRLGADPPVTRDAPWASGRARELAVAACYDCRSNQPRRPLYSRVAPFSWLIARDVEQGRDKLNFSTWEGSGGDARDAAYGQLDIDITKNYAPWLSYDNRNQRDFVSARVGGYVFQPANAAADLATFFIK